MWLSVRTYKNCLPARQHGLGWRDQSHFHDKIFLCGQPPLMSAPQLPSAWPQQNAGKQPLVKLPVAPYRAPNLVSAVSGWIRKIIGDDTDDLLAKRSIKNFCDEAVLKNSQATKNIANCSLIESYARYGARTYTQAMNGALVNRR